MRIINRKANVVLKKTQLADMATIVMQTGKWGLEEVCQLIKNDPSETEVWLEFVMPEFIMLPPIVIEIIKLTNCETKVIQFFYDHLRCDLSKWESVSLSILENVLKSHEKPSALLMLEKVAKHKTAHDELNEKLDNLFCPLLELVINHAKENLATEDGTNFITGIKDLLQNKLKTRQYSGIEFENVHYFLKK